jgi:hypothetical protein
MSGTMVMPVLPPVVMPLSVIAELAFDGHLLDATDAGAPNHIRAADEFLDILLSHF